jgi:hypothetical protein
LVADSKGHMTLIGAVAPRISRMKGNQVATSIPLSFAEERAEEPIAEIVVGPRNLTHLFDLANLLHESGLTRVNVTRSEIQYR